ncbi:MAG: hypothetical protein HC884_17210 [Chloroflexaceae bacterium]|nr:hypothetical protein [Chloroflexaceae bacterium]
MTSEMVSPRGATAPRTTTWQDWGFLWLVWVWACALGMGVGLLLCQLMSGPLPSTPISLMTNFVGGVIVGTTTGFAQWLVLRGFFPRERWWLLASTFAWAIAWEAGWTLQEMMDNLAGWVLGWATIGAMVGLVQGIMLSRHFRRGGWWLVANILGYAMGGAVAGLVFDITFDIMSVVGASRTGMIIAMGGMVLGPGIVYGIITGGVLVWMVRGGGKGKRPSRDRDGAASA